MVKYMKYERYEYTKYDKHRAYGGSGDNKKYEKRFLEMKYVDKVTLEPIVKCQKVRNIESIRLLISKLFNISLFPEEIYFLSKMPSQIDPFSIIIISTFSILITCLVSIYPAIKASKVDTINSLKYE